MNTLRLSAMAALSAAILMPSPALAFVPADPFGLGVSVFEICDLKDHAPIGDKCYGFVGAVAEIVVVN